ncbi:MAG: hypothetical protein ACRDQH_11395 [Pseudonocardiaceae bacterium]
MRQITGKGRRQILGVAPTVTRRPAKALMKTKVNEIAGRIHRIATLI